MTESKHLHFIGIGGSSMSGLAHLMREQGCTVSGSDSTASHKTEHLMDEGIEVFIGHAPENVRGADLVVYSAAIPPENPERQEAERLGIPQIERATLLGRLMDRLRPVHLASAAPMARPPPPPCSRRLFVECGMNPSVHIGGELARDRRQHPAAAAARPSSPRRAEFNRSFLQFHPTIAVILNIDEDHLDCLQATSTTSSSRLARSIASLVPEGGWVRRLGRRPPRAPGAARSSRGIATRAPTAWSAFNELRAENVVTYDEQGFPFLHRHALLRATRLVRRAACPWPPRPTCSTALAALAVADICQLPMQSRRRRCFPPSPARTAASS